MKYKIINAIKSIVLLFIIIISIYLTKKFISGILALLILSLLNHFFPKTIDSVIASFLDLFNYPSWKKSQKNLEKKGKLQKDTIIRISFAYLFRIKVDGKYFLVPNSRTGKYQPVGGAYKFNEKETIYLSENFYVEDDDCIPISKVTKRDYRLLIKNMYLKKFMKRFNTTENRENIRDLSREFKEEIFNTNILKVEDFGKLSYKYCGRHITKIVDTVFRPFEILLADIVEVILTEEQENLFRKLMKKESNSYIFATPQEIKRCGIKVGSDNLSDNIANHTFKILSENNDLLINRNKNKGIFTVEL